MNEPVQTLFPLYIVSKGRAAYPMTIAALSRFRVPFTLICEGFEADAYRDVLAAHGGFGTVLQRRPQLVLGGG